MMCGARPPASLGNPGAARHHRQGGLAISDLTVIGYPDEQTAARVWDALVRLQKGYLADLKDAAIIRRDSKGKLHVTRPAHHAVAGGTVLRTSLTHGSEQQLMKVLHGPGPATATWEGTPDAATTRG
jgi:uncharacterized membrane protein